MRTINKQDTKQKSAPPLSARALKQSGVAKAINSPLGKPQAWFDIAKPAYDEKGNANFMDKSGKLIAGIYRDMPNSIYHSLPALSSSALKKFSESPAKYYRTYIKPVLRVQTDTSTRSLDTGSLVHMLILETAAFYTCYCREPVIHDPAFSKLELLVTAEDIRNVLRNEGLKTSGKKEELVQRLLSHDEKAPIWDHIKEQELRKNGKRKEVVVNGELKVLYGGKEPVNGIMWDDAMRAYSVVHTHQEAHAMLLDGESEVTFIAECPIVGWVKAKFDFLRYDNNAVDLKSTKSARPRDFINDIEKFKYDIQIVFYKHVAKLLQVYIKQFPIIAVEYQDADICQPFNLTSEAEHDADEDLIHLLEDFAQCKRNNDWYGYHKKDAVVMVPSRKNRRGVRKSV